MGPDVDAEGYERWINGLAVYPYPTDVPDVYDPCAGTAVATTKGFGDELPQPEYGAYTLWMAETCTSSRTGDHDAFKSRLVAALAATESYGVAHELLTGLRMPDNPHLSDGSGTFPNLDAPTSVDQGLALLEGEIAKSGRQGLIHCSPMVATKLRQYFAVDNKTGVIRTVNGIVVIPDFGYVYGATPHGHDDPGDNQEWIYATGPIDVRRSEVEVLPETPAQALDRGTGATEDHPNAVTYRAERYYSAIYDTAVQAAVMVDLCSSEC